jgi:hypothetical protein
MADLIANEEYDRRISNRTNQRGALFPLKPIEHRGLPSALLVELYDSTFHVLQLVIFALFPRSHIATNLLLRDTIFSRLEMHPKRAQNISHFDGCHSGSQTMVHYYS